MECRLKDFSERNVRSEIHSALMVISVLYYSSRIHKSRIMTRKQVFFSKHISCEHAIFHIYGDKRHTKKIIKLKSISRDGDWRFPKVNLTRFLFRIK